MSDRDKSHSRLRRLVAAAPRSVRLALLVSVCLNLGLLGVIAGSALDQARRPPPKVGEVGFGPYTGALTDEQRDRLRAAFLAERPDYRDLRRKLRDDFGQVLATLRREPFDPEALRGVMAEQGTRFRTGMDLGERLLIEELTRMTPEQRAAFTDRLEAALNRHRGGPRPRED